MIDPKEIEKGEITVNNTTYKMAEMPMEKAETIFYFFAQHAINLTSGKLSFLNDEFRAVIRPLMDDYILVDGNKVSTLKQNGIIYWYKNTKDMLKVCTYALVFFTIPFNGSLID